MSTIPAPLDSPNSINKPRRFYTQLPPGLYLKFESEALRRGVHGFKLAESVLTAWLNGDLVVRNEVEKNA